MPDPRLILPVCFRTWGHPEHGQLGHNTEGQYIEKAGKVLFHFVHEPTKIVMYIEKDPRSKQVSPVPGVVIKEVSCGSNHTVVIDEKFRVRRLFGERAQGLQKLKCRGGRGVKCSVR